MDTTTYQLIEEGTHYDTITAPSLSAAMDVARANVDRANYSDATGTIWVDVRVREIVTRTAAPECAQCYETAVGYDDDGDVACAAHAALAGPVPSETVTERSDDDHDRVQLDPEEPSCCAGSHDWQSPHEIVGGITENPGVWGHGGGVVIHEVCVHCGTERVTDTWAQDPETGEQGLESVEYHEGRYADDVAEVSP